MYGRSVASGKRSWLLATHRVCTTHRAESFRLPRGAAGLGVARGDVGFAGGPVGAATCRLRPLRRGRRRAARGAPDLPCAAATWHSSATLLQRLTTRARLAAPFAQVEEIGAIWSACGNQLTEAEVLDLVTELKPDLRRLPFEEFVNMLSRPMWCACPRSASRPARASAIGGLSDHHSTQGPPTTKPHAPQTLAPSPPPCSARTTPACGIAQRPADARATGSGELPHLLRGAARDHGGDAGGGDDQTGPAGLVARGEGDAGRGRLRQGSDVPLWHAPHTLP